MRVGFIHVCFPSGWGFCDPYIYVMLFHCYGEKKREEEEERETNLKHD